MIKANFSAYSKYVTDSLNQWDQNRTLQVSGLNLTVKPEVHFSNAKLGGAIVVQADLVNHVVMVPVPNSLLQDPLRIFAHIGVYEGDEFKVVELVEIPVIPRKRPNDYELAADDYELYSFKRLENMIQNINDTWVNKNEEQVEEYVTAWLDEHPEATTTVQDGSLSIDKMVVGTLGYVTPQMFGAKGDGVTDDTAAVQAAMDALGVSASVLLIPTGTYRVTRQVDIANKSGVKILGAGQPTISVKSQEAITSAFCITDYNNVEVSGIKFVSTRDKAGTPPSGHIRVNNTSSNIYAIFASRGDTLVCKNNTFENMESDYWIVNEENKNVTIDGWTSDGASIPMYTTHLKDSVIKNAKVKPATGLGGGDHCLYISTLCDNVRVENSVFESQDDCIGPLFSFYNANHETDEAYQPKRIVFRNVTAKGCRLIVGNIFADITFDNLEFEQLFDHYAYAFNSDGSVKYADITNHILGAAKLTLKDSRVKCIKGDFYLETEGRSAEVCFDNSIFSVPERLLIAGVSGVNIKNCDIDCKILLYTGGPSDALSVDVRNCKIKASGTYLISRRGSNKGIIIVRDSLIKNTSGSTRSLVYNGGSLDSTGIKFLGNYCYNCKQADGVDGQNMVRINNYNDDAVFD